MGAIKAKVFYLFEHPPDDRLLKAEASELSGEMGYDGVTASNGWLHRFQKFGNYLTSLTCFSLYHG